MRDFLHCDKKIPGFFALVCAFLALAAAVTVGLFRGYTGYGFYMEKGFRLGIFFAALFLILLAAALARFTEGILPERKGGGIAAVCSSLLLCGLLFVLAVRLFAFAGGATSVLKGCEILCGLLALVAVGYRLVRIFLPSVKDSTLSIFAVLSAFLYGLLAVMLYFEKSQPINAPIKLAEQVAFLSLSMEALLDARVLLGREKPRIHFAVLSAACGLCFFSSVPTILYAVFRGEVVSADLFLTLLLFLCGADALIRTVGALFDRKTA